MPDLTAPWQIQPTVSPPEWFIQTVKQFAPNPAAPYAAQLLWQRGIRDKETLTGFLSADRYQAASPFAFGPEMQSAVDRLQQAYTSGEVVAIWGDFDADGVTATAVLWDGLGQFFPQSRSLIYYIPNRLTESHGLSQQGIETLHQKGCQLIITCDTGSTNLAEIEYARGLGIDVIVTDHHTLSESRPPVSAIVNPRSLPTEHPLAHLSGVAVAYKLVEALYQTLPDVPQQPLESLLDLVAIGLIADLVELKGDCRYLAQRGIEQLQTQSNPATATRPGVARLLELCKRSGDRPTDISFGLGPRINAVSRIHGDAHFCVELLTSRDAHLCRHLAEATELANTRRKALQKDVAQRVKARVAQIDLSTTDVIVLADEQWPIGVLGLVAGQIAQEYGRPTILLSTEGSEQSGMARGSARSVNHIDLYQLVQDQAHLLHRFGGHPYAAGLSLPIANVPLFTEAINQHLRQRSDLAARPTIQADLQLTVADLGRDLFQALKLLEPYGMGNPVPKLFIQNCWFEQVRNKNIKDWKGGTVRYIKTEFEICDDSTERGFPGLWWEHYQDEVPKGRCDAIAELDFNAYQKRYEIRLTAVRPSEATVQTTAGLTSGTWILDWRGMERQGDRATGQQGGTERELLTSAVPLIMRQSPTSWADLQVWFRRAVREQRSLAIAYPSASQTAPQAIWQQLVGIAKYLDRTGQTATRAQLLNRLGIGDRTLRLGFKTLEHLGFTIRAADNILQITWQNKNVPLTDTQLTGAVEQFAIAITEEQFRRQYFDQIPLETIQAIAAQTTANEPASAGLPPVR